MCFTIEIKLTRDAIENRFRVNSDILEDFKFKYYYKAFNNPMIPVVSQDQPDNVQLMQWGLIPGWVKNGDQAEKIRAGTYNARGESVHVKPSFRKSFAQNRCWVLAHGFFEWEHRGKEKIPWYIRRKDDQPFALAGLCDTWKAPENGQEISTFSIITCKANPMMARIHNSKKRMPVILDEPTENAWIDRELSPMQLRELLVPLDENLLQAHPVGKEFLARNADPSSPDVIRKHEYPADQSLF